MNLSQEGNPIQIEIILLESGLGSYYLLANED